jgi:uncharacterized protein YqhQ
MVKEKRERNKKKSEKKESKKYGEKLGNAGFILGILSIVFGIMIAPILGILLAMVGFSLCIVQQKKNPTKKGKLGLILNIIGLSISIIWWIIVLKVIFPLVQDQLQNFPVN